MNSWRIGLLRTKLRFKGFVRLVLLIVFYFYIIKHILSIINIVKSWSAYFNLL